MSEREPTIGEPVQEPPGFSFARVREVRARDLALRFASGAVTSVVAGVVTILFGARPGGILLAFPAIIAASLTLIEEEEDGIDAREDSRGAVAGGVAMAAFAIIAAVLFTRLPIGVALAAAALGWVVVALGLYRLAWHRRH